MGKGRIKRILRLCHFEFFDKGEGRHKRIQAVSPPFFWKREERVGEYMQLDQNSHSQVMYQSKGFKGTFLFKVRLFLK